MSSANDMILAVPDWASLDTLVQRLDPPVLWPVGSAPLLGHWMDEARRRGATRVVIHCADRPQALRAWLEGGAYWSCPVEVLPTALQDTPAAAEWLDALPGEDLPQRPADGAGLVRWWFDRQQAWLLRREAHATLLDTPHPSGGWVGPRVRIDPTAKLTGPFWIGGQAQIGPRCEIGPGTLIGPGVTLDDNVHIEHASVLADTYVGRNLELRNAIASGGVLIDVARGCRVDIGENFILSTLARPKPQVPWRDVFLAALLWPVAQLASWLGDARRSPRRFVAVSPSGPIPLLEGSKGSLLARRADWLGHVLSRRMRLVGPLPRTEAELARHPADLGNLLRSACPGVFSFADLHGCHQSGDGDELMHALYETVQPEAGRLVWRSLPRLLRLKPESSAS